MRALVLQGGGALGAFDTGAFKALYKKVQEKTKKMEIKKRDHYLILLLVPQVEQ